MPIEANFHAQPLGAYPATGAGRKKDDPQRVHDAAQQFESLMMAQLMKSMREGGESGLSAGNDAASSTALEMAEAEFAKALSQRGGLGLARLVESGLSRSSSSAHVPEAQKPPAAQKENE